MFTGHLEIIDKSAPMPFNQYLLIESDNGYRCEAYGFDDDTVMDIDAMLEHVYADFTVTTDRPMCGPNYAAIITDNRTPDSVVVWTHCDFFLD